MATIAKRSGHWLLALTMLLVPVAQADESKGWNEASAVIEGATRDVIQLMEDKTLLEESAEDLLIAEVDKVLSPVVDFSYIAKGVMGKYYRKANDAERERFAEVFKTTLLKTYAKALVGFKIEKYALVPPRGESPHEDKQIVSVDVFAADGSKYTLIYYMRKQEQSWMLVNAVLDGSINIRLSFKNQFAEMMQEHRGDVSKVIASWKDKVDPGKESA
ncbi:MlaC/ttg2D family ABC transporter substrate-binding protein [Neptuniibacter halophilus]|uniref:MlaC/ttg2D family ABC transporter substrate-binding protein n=1 Tax=Neptuniibacter halophilus TaxID=651666 RepID=UPI0025728312|nr:ABC transporter substrate-binding protein [Neptuniibacter halophilus]